MFRKNLTTGLSRIRNSFVIARNTAFTFKSKNIDTKEISKQLGVRYVLEGSVQRDQTECASMRNLSMARPARIFGPTGSRRILPIFSSCRIRVARIANSLRVELVNAESHCPRPQNLDAVDLTMRGWALLWQKPTRETDRTARDLFEQAVKLDPTNAEAYTGLAYSHARDFANGWPDRGPITPRLVIKPADRALAINPGNGMAAYAKGLFLTLAGQSAEAKTIVEAALQRNPNSGRVDGFSQV